MSVIRSYLDTTKIFYTRKKAKAQMIIGVVITAFYSFGFFVNENDIDEAVMSLATLKATLVPLMVPGIYLIWCALQNYKMAKLAEEYDKVIASDKNGIVTATEIEKATGKKFFDIMVELNKLFGKGFFTNCVLQQGRNPGIIVNTAQVGDDKGVGFMQMTCPKCGGYTRVRAGGMGECEFCGSKIKAPKQ